MHRLSNNMPLIKKKKKKKRKKEKKKKRERERVKYAHLIMYIQINDKLYIN